jgi:hypothetical protein
LMINLYERTNQETIVNAFTVKCVLVVKLNEI